MDRKKKRLAVLKMGPNIFINDIRQILRTDLDNSPLAQPFLKSFYAEFHFVTVIIPLICMVSLWNSFFIQSTWYYHSL